MKILLLSVVASGLLSAGAAAVVQSWRYRSMIDEMKIEHFKKVRTLEVSNDLLKTQLEERNNERLEAHTSAILKAQEDANTQNRKTSVVAADNRSVASRLSCPSPTDQSRTRDSGSENSATASFNAAPAAQGSDVFTACATSVAVLAERCDRHVEDIRVIKDVTCSDTSSSSYSSFCSSDSSCDSGSGCSSE